MVTGALGGSIRGKHLDFTPRVQEALLLHERADLHAMIDLSDGLAADVHHLCEESGCGACIRAEAVPISDVARQIDDALSPLDHALGDGEDFELAFAVPPKDGQQLLAQQPIPGLRLSHIGEFSAERTFLIERSGRREVLEPNGFRHRW